MKMEYSAKSTEYMSSKAHHYAYNIMPYICMSDILMVVEEAYRKWK